MNNDHSQSLNLADVSKANKSNEQGELQGIFTSLMSLAEIIGSTIVHVVLLQFQIKCSKFQPRTRHTISRGSIHRAVSFLVDFMDPERIHENG